MSGAPDPQGSLPDDAGLGQLLAEGLGRAAGAPVDERELLAGAHRGAGRIRRRRRAALGVATVLVFAAPVGLFTRGFLPQSSVTTAGSSARQDSAEPAAAEAGSAVAAPGAAGGGPGQPGATAAPGDAGELAAGSAVASGPGGPDAKAPGAADASRAAGAVSDATPSPAAPISPGPLLASPSAPVATPTAATSFSAPVTTPAPPTASRTAATATRLVTGPRVVPPEVLPVVGDLSAITLRQTSDTANRTPAGAMSAADTCGTALTGRPADAGSRAVALEHRTGAVGSSWLLGGTVRVFAGDGAVRYLTAVDRLACARPVAVAGAEAAFVGHGAADAQGRTHWYAVVRVGRVVSEVRLVVPKGARVGEADIVRLVRLSGDRLVRSGFAATVASDPGLR